MYELAGMIQDVQHLEPIQHTFDCVECPAWKEGILDVPLQWGRNFIIGFDMWLILLAVLGGIVFIIAFPPTRRIIKLVIEVTKTVWKDTARKK